MPTRILAAAGPAWSALAERLDELIDAQGFELIKATARTRAGFLSHEGRTVFVKRVETGGFLKGLVARIVGSRAVRAWRGAEILGAGGFNHPRPLMVVEEREWGAIKTSYIVTEALRAPRVLSEVAIGRRRDPVLRKATAQLAAREIRRLHDAGIYTRDMQETNLLIETRDGELVLHFVDFEDFRRTARVSWRRRMVNLVHLDRSIGRFASRAHRLRFFYFYLQGRPGRVEARRLLRDFGAVRARIERRSGSAARASARLSDSFSEIALNQETGRAAARKR